MSEDFREFLKEVEKTEEGGFKRISKEIDTRYELAAIITKLEEKRQLPVLFFEKVKNSDFPVVTNCYSNRSRVAKAIGISPQDLNKRFQQAIDCPIFSVIKEKGPVQDIIIEGDKVDLSKLPLMMYHDTDGAPYITAGILIAKDPDSGIYNASYNRLMLKGRNKLGIFMTIGKHLHEIYSKAEERGKPLPVAISIGNHPAWAMGALYIGPYNHDEIGIMGGLSGKAMEMVRCKSVEMEAPAKAEIIIEGEIEPIIREEEGPFGEFSGYATGRGPAPIITVKAITQRKEAIYQDICGGSHREHLVMATIPMEVNLYRAIKQAVPTVIDARIPAPFTLVISIKKRYEGQPRSAIMAALNADMYLKHVIVVDEDIDVTNLQRVVWAIATRTQADRDIFIIPKMRGSSLDPSAPEVGVVTKMGIDATAKPSLSHFAPQNKIPDEVMNRIRLEDYNLG